MTRVWERSVTDFVGGEAEQLSSGAAAGSQLWLRSDWLLLAVVMIVVDQVGYVCCYSNSLECDAQGNADGGADRHGRTNDAQGVGRKVSQVHNPLLSRAVRISHGLQGFIGIYGSSENSGGNVEGLDHSNKSFQWRKESGSHKEPDIYHCRNGSCYLKKIIDHSELAR